MENNIASETVTEDEFFDLFTNRDSNIQQFNDAIQSRNSDSNNILVFYGFGGIGKSWLLRYLSEKVRKENSNDYYKYLVGDFSVPEISFRPEELLLKLRLSFDKKENIKFLAFDIALIKYWQVAYPGESLKDSLSGLFDAQGTLSCLVDIFGTVSDFVIPASGLVAKAIGHISQQIEDVKYQNCDWAKDSIDALRRVENIKAYDIVNDLPMLLGVDLKSHLKRKPGFIPIIFIDSFDIPPFTVSSRDCPAIYAKDIVHKLIVNTKGVVFVLGSRDRLIWNPFMNTFSDPIENQYEVFGLSEAESTNYLKKLRVNDNNILNVIIDGSGGSPFVLYLRYKIYMVLMDIYGADVGSRLSDSFSVSNDNIVNRFLKNLSSDEMFVVKVLSSSSFFNNKLFDQMRAYFCINHSIFFFEKFIKYSFVESSGGGNYRLKKVFKDQCFSSFVSEINDSELLKVHDFNFKSFYECFESCWLDGDLNDSVGFLIESLSQKIKLASYPDCFCWVSDVEIKYFSEPFHNRYLLFVWKELIGYSDGVVTEDVVKVKIDIFNKIIEILEVTGSYVDLVEIGEYLYGVLVDTEFYSDRLDLCRKLSHYHRVVNADLDASEKYIKEALLLLEKIAPVPLGLESIIKSETALVYYDQGRYKLSKRLSEEALSSYGSQIDSNVISFKNNYALSMQRLGKYEDALRIYEEVLKFYEDSSELYTENIARSHNNIYICLRELGKNRLAEENIKKTIIVCEKIFPEGHLFTAKAYEHFAYILKQVDSLDLALVYFDKALVMIRSCLFMDNESSAMIFRSIAQIQIKKNKYDEARINLDKAFLFFENITPVNNIQIASTIFAEASLLEMVEADKLKVISRYMEGVEYSLKEVDDDDVEVNSIRLTIGCLYFDVRDYKNAEEFCLKALWNFKKKLPKDNYRIPYALLTLSSIYVEKNNFKYALECAIEAVSIYEKDEDGYVSLLSSARQHLKDILTLMKT